MTVSREYRVDFKEVDKGGRHNRVGFTLVNAEDASDAASRFLLHNEGADVLVVRPTDDQHNPVQ